MLSTFTSLAGSIAKILIPAAMAISINGYYKAPVSPQQFEGTYNVVSGSCAQGQVTARFDVASSTLTLSSDEQEVVSFPSIDQGTQAIEHGQQRTTADGYGVIKTITTDTTAMRSVTTTASLKNGRLEIERVEQAAFSRGQGSRSQSCVLQK